MNRLDPKTELFELCEHLEEEAHEKLKTAIGDSHEQGYWRGQMKTAKTIRNVMGNVYREYEDKNPVFIYGH